MFDRKQIFYYGAAMALVAVASYVGAKFRNPFENRDDEYDLVRKYLLNDSPLYGMNKPKLWIHTKYEYNARKWQSFYSRSSYDLNQPYIHVTIKSIVNHCGDDFHVCLIDDNTFSKLLPAWDIDLTHMAEPFKSQARQVGMCELLYYYGGMTLPNSFLCMKPLHEFYLQATADDKPFVAEGINRHQNLVRQGVGRRPGFVPETAIMGANKHDATMKELCVYLKSRIQSPHFSSESDFLGDLSYWCADAVESDKMNLVGGEFIGVKTAKGKPILLEHLIEEEYLDLSDDCVGLTVPYEDVLARTKYQWLAVMDSREILNSQFVLSKYMRLSILSGNRDHLPPKIVQAIAL